MSRAVSFEEYIGSLGRLTGHIDPTASTPEAEAIKAASESLERLPAIDPGSLSSWSQDHPQDIPVLGLIVGLSQERLKNALKDQFDTSGWQTLARDRPEELIDFLDRDYDLVRLLETQ